MFLPCRKTITGEVALKMIFSEWIRHYGKPREIMSDNDVRFTSENGWWRRVFKNLDIKVNFSIPRRPESNGLCERINRSFNQNMRILMSQTKTKDWVKLVPGS
jgi:transposase InsO family protein